MKKALLIAGLTLAISIPSAAASGQKWTDTAAMALYEKAKRACSTTGTTDQQRECEQRQMLAAESIVSFILENRGFLDRPPLTKNEAHQLVSRCGRVWVTDRLTDYQQFQACVVRGLQERGVRVAKPAED